MVVRENERLAAKYFGLLEIIARIDNFSYKVGLSDIAKIYERE